MKSSVVIKTISLITAGIISLTAFSGCSKSFLFPEESTTKAEFDEDALREEYERTSVPGEETEAVTEETTEAVTEESTTEAATEESTTEAEETTAEEESSSELETAISTAVSTVSTTLRTIVNTENKTTETKEDYKYGVKKINVVSTYYDIYSDGTKEKNTAKSKSYVKYDYSGFSAKTSEMKSEAATNSETYATQATDAIAAVNALRSSELTADADLTTAANIRAVEMAYSNKVSGTTRPNKSNWNTVLTDLGLEAKSSSIDFVCSGYSTGASAVKAISSTSSNKTKMQDTHYKKIGVGFAKNPEGKMYCCIIVTE